MLRLSDIEFAYPRGGRVLAGASLEVAPGEHVVLLGSNGCGKSTLARLANGSIEPAAGLVEVDGEVSREGARRTFFEEVGYVQQDPRAQLVTSSVRDEVAFGPRNLRLEAAEVERRVGRALEACDLERLADRSVMELSGGQQQRLAFAGVLAMEPRYLVLDEVSAQLDSAARERVADLVRRVRRRGAFALGAARRRPGRACGACARGHGRCGRGCGRHGALRGGEGPWGEAAGSSRRRGARAWRRGV